MKKWIAFLGLFFLTACIGTSLPTTFYTLKPGEPTKTFPTTATIGVDPVKLPAFLDKPQIVVRQKDGIQLKFSETHRWSEPLSSLLQRTLAEDMTRALPKAEVKPKTSARERFDYVVAVEIADLSGAFEGEMTLDAWWSITDTSGYAIARRRTTLSEPLKDSYADLVLTQGKLVNRLADEIARQIAGLQKK